MAVEQDASSQRLLGLVRATLCTPERHGHFSRVAPTDDDAGDVLYGRNIQVAD
jgi:hypothetical protein